MTGEVVYGFYLSFLKGGEMTMHTDKPIHKEFRTQLSNMTGVYGYVPGEGFYIEVTQHDIGETISDKGLNNVILADVLLHYIRYYGADIEEGEVEALLVGGFLKDAA